MKYSDIDVFCCPECRGSLKFLEIKTQDRHSEAAEVLEGLITCVICQAVYPVIESIPYFGRRDNYVSSFSYQWKRFSRTQFTDYQRQITQQRFYHNTKWPQHLEGELILEAGCGIGRFSEVVLERGAEVYAFDLSASVEVAKENIKSVGLQRHYHLFQADIYKIPLPYCLFNRIFCLGVLQHCPDVQKAYLSLIPFLKVDGELAVDCYLRQPLKDMFNLKYLLRPFFKWWNHSWLVAFCTFTISLAYAIKSFLSKIPFIGALISRVIPIGRLNYEPKYSFSVSELKEIKTLSMFDMLSPRYDQPQKISHFRSWMEKAGLEILELTTGYNGINARARKKI